MFYRETGVFRESYAADMALFPIPLDRWGVLVLLLFAILGVPYLTSQYWMGSLIIPFLIFALSAQGLNFLTGYAGQLSLGHAAFMGVGAYGAVILYGRYGVPLLPSLLGGGIIAAVVGALIGISLFRYKLLAFAVSSFYAGVAGGLMSFTYYAAANIEEFNLLLSFRLLGMIIIGGMGSVLGSFLGAGFIVLLPIFF